MRFSREVLAAWWRGADVPRGVLEFWIEADAFMRHMNRVLVGTMLDVAAGRRPVSEFRELLAGRPRSEAGRTAPAHGLYLAGVGLWRRAGAPTAAGANTRAQPINPELRVLLTNDDGIEAAGLQALRKSLLTLPGISWQ